MKKNILLATIFCFFSYVSVVFANDDDAKDGSFKVMIADDFEKKSEVAEGKNHEFNHLLIDEVSFDDNYQTTNRKNEYKDLTADTKFLSQIKAKNGLFMRSYFRLLESDQSSETNRRNQLENGGGDRSFENLGIRTEELNIGYESDKIALFAGKFLLNFGDVWRWNKSVWLTDIAENNYREAEKLGATTFLKIGDSKKTGRYYFGFSAFTNDRKNLDNSIITGRDSATKSDAKAGDTRSLKSYAISMDTKFDFAKEEKLSYHFAYSDMAVNERASSVAANRINSQKSFVAGMKYQYPLTENIITDSVLEYSTKKNIDGDSDVAEDYLTAAISAQFKKHFYLTTGVARERQNHKVSTGFDNSIFEFSFGYEFSKTVLFDKLIIQAGYKNQRLDYRTNIETNNVFGGLIRAVKHF